ncbi:hypothetical protein D3C81_311080 [compost metagenome]
MGRQFAGMRTRGNHKVIAGDQAFGRAHACHAIALALDFDDGRVFEDATAEVFQRPRIGLQGAVRIGMAAKMVVVARQHVVTGKGNEFAHLLRVQEVDAQPVPGSFIHDFLIEGNLVFGQVDTDAIRAVLGRITEQFVHHRPQPLLFDKQRTVVMRAPAAVTSRCAPANQACVKDQHIDAIARQPPRGAQSCHAATDDDDGGAGG